MKKKWFLIALILITYSTNAYAEGVTPAKVEINFSPNLKIDIPYKVTGYNSPEITTDCPQYLKYNNNQVKNTDGTTFTITATLPSKMPLSGQTECGVRIREGTPPTPALIDIRTELIASIKINTLYPGEYAQITLTANNANQGYPINFKVTAENFGEQEIKDTYATIELTNGKKATIIKTAQTNILPQSNIELTKQLDTTEYEPGRYTATAKLPYQGGTATAEYEFIIGTFLVNLIAYPTEIEIGEIKPFDISIESLWGETIKNAYATIYVTNKNSEQIAELKTQATQISPWQKTTLNAKINTTQFTPGEYNIKITIHYDGETSSENGKLTLKLPSTESTPLLKKITGAVSNPITIATAISIIILIDMIWIIRKRSKINL
ncbi:MAG: hypothetical protein ABIH53_02155 [archaeon]